MRFLLDTQIFMGIIEQNTDKFPIRIRNMIADPANGFYVSVASLWEISIKFRLGKLPLPFGIDRLPDAVRDAGLQLWQSTNTMPLPKSYRNQPRGTHLTGCYWRNAWWKACGW
jgi:PIN domain nuclease of toxin-antitoxin system